MEPKHSPRPAYDKCNQGHRLVEVYDERYNKYVWDCPTCKRRMDRLNAEWRRERGGTGALTAEAGYVLNCDGGRCRWATIQAGGREFERGEAGSREAAMDAINESLGRMMAKLGETGAKRLLERPKFIKGFCFSCQRPTTSEEAVFIDRYKYVCPECAKKMGITDRAPPSTGARSNLALLTPEEDAYWNYAWPFYMNEGYGEKRATEAAWRDLQELFPRLRAYRGCHPGVARPGDRRYRRRRR